MHSLESSGLSRSELYTRAVEEFLARRPRRRGSAVTQALRKAYRTGSSRIPVRLERAQLEILEREDW